MRVNLSFGFKVWIIEFSVLFSHHHPPVDAEFYSLSYFEVAALRVNWEAGKHVDSWASLLGILIQELGIGTQEYERSSDMLGDLGADDVWTVPLETLFLCFCCFLIIVFL